MKPIAISAAVASLLACGGSKPMTGDYADVDPASVLTFDYTTPDFQVAAHRFTETDSFRVAVRAKRGKGFKLCTSDETFAQAIAPFESIKIKRHIERSEYAKLSKNISYHRLRYTTAPPMEGFERVLTPLSNGHLALQHEDAGYELTLTTSAVDKLAQSCRNAESEPSH